MYYKLAYLDASELKCQSKAPKFKPYQNCTTILPLPLSPFSFKGTQCFLSEEHIVSQQNSIPSRKFIAKGVSLYAKIDDFTCRKCNWECDRLYTTFQRYLGSHIHSHLVNEH